MAAVFSAGLVIAAEQTGKLKIEVGRAPVTDGRQLYASYCASCHGMDGKGAGPVADSLKTTPSDLTQLSRNNNGKYPALHVAGVLRSGVSTPAHGTATMPVWGPVFANIDRTSHPTRSASDKLLRISNLNRYIEGIQAK